MPHIPAEVVQACSGVISPNQKLKVKMGYLQVSNQVLDSNITGYIANREISIAVLIQHHNLQEENINVDIDIL